MDWETALRSRYLSASFGWTSHPFTKATLLLVLSCCLSGTSTANVTIKKYLPTLAEYRFDSLEEISRIEGRARLGSLNSALLEEYGFLSYSRWHLRNRSATLSSAIELEVHEMLDAAGAFGIFSLQRPVPSEMSGLELAVENFYSEDSLTFWRGPYAFRLRRKRGDANEVEPLRQVAASLIKAIPLLNVHPVSVLYLPQDHLIQDSIRFYLGKHSLGLNPDFPSQVVPVLGFADRAEVAYARYNPGESSLFLLGYPTPALAEDYFKKINDLLHSHISTTGIYMKRSGLLVSLLVGPEEQARKILSKVAYTPSVKWIYDKRKKPTLRDDASTFLGMVKSVGLGALCFIFASLGGGAVVGFFRHHLLERYLPWSGKGGMIRLNINER